MSIENYNVHQYYCMKPCIKSEMEIHVVGVTLPMCLKRRDIGAMGRFILFFLQYLNSSSVMHPVVHTLSQNIVAIQRRHTGGKNKKLPISNAINKTLAFHLYPLLPFLWIIHSRSGTKITSEDFPRFQMKEYSR